MTQPKSAIADTEKKLTCVRSWLVKNMGRFGDAQDLRVACEKACRVSGRRVWEVMASMKQVSQLRSSRVAHKYTKDLAGVAGFRKTFSKTERNASKITNGINTILKQRGWMYDPDFRGELGISVVDWTVCKREYEHLIVIVRENGGRRSVWCHPSIVESCREIAEQN